MAWQWVGGLVLVAGTLLAYIPALQAGFIWDDNDYVLNNLTLRSLDGLRQIWFEIEATPQYYPLVHTSFWLEYHVWELNSTGYHVINVLLHCLASLLVWRILSFLRVPGSWAVAAIFALHPVHVESVAWITERKNVLSGVFYLGSGWAFLLYTSHPERARSKRLYTISLVLFVCALFSKTVTLTLPAALLLVLWWKLDQIRRVDLLPLAPFFIVGVTLGLVTLWTEAHHVGASGNEWDLSLAERILLAGKAPWFYVGKLILPTQLTFVYPRWVIDSGAWKQYLWPVGTLLVIIVLWLTRLRIGKGPLVSVLFFGGSLMPALGFFDVYPFRYSFVTDHFQYLASLGVITLIVSAAGTTLKTTLVKPALALVLVAFSTLTWNQGYVYEDLESLWRDTLDKNPNAWIAHNNLGLLLREQGEHEWAIHHYRQALLLNPDFYEAHNNLGIALRSRNRLEEAAGHYRRAIELRADLVEVYANLGNVLAAQGKTTDAIDTLRQALRLKPAFASHAGLANLLTSQSQHQEAIKHYQAALEFELDNAATRNNFGVALRASGRSKEALAEFRRAIQIDDDFVEAHDNFAWSMKQEGAIDEALEHFLRAIELNRSFLPSLVGASWIMATHWDIGARQTQKALVLAERAMRLSTEPNVQILDTAAAAYAAAGNFDRAIETARQARALAIKAEAIEFANPIADRLRLYEEGRPFVESKKPGR